MKRAVWIVLDSFGLGAAPDASAYGDEGADTFGHIVDYCTRSSRGPLRVPNLARLGLYHAHAAAHNLPAPSILRPVGYWGHAVERARGKDTPSGHWESMGVTLDVPFALFQPGDHCFPESLIGKLVEEAAIPGVLGNEHASGTEIMARLGAEHVRSGKPIVYTSADSVFQVAAHEGAFGLDRLYEVCTIARRLCSPLHIGRVIARPFVGSAEAGFHRTPHRHDYTLPPPRPTLLDAICADHHAVIAIGKMSDIFAHRGVSKPVFGANDDELMDATIASLAKVGDGDLVATNLVQFDSVYGHRRNPSGYAAALESFDHRLGELEGAMRPGDLLIVSADHGNDPTWTGTDHTREQIPVLAFEPERRGRDVGQRDSFADIGQTIAAHLGMAPIAEGRSFLGT